MVKEAKPINEQDAVEVLKSRGLSCAKIKQMIKNKQKDAEMFRKVGFTGKLAQREEASAKDLQALKKKVCLLK